MDTHLTVAPPAAPADLRRIEAALSTLRRAERDVSAMAAYLAEAREAVEARPAEPDAARRATMAELRMRGDALALAQDLAALAQPEA